MLKKIFLSLSILLTPTLSVAASNDNLYNDEIFERKPDITPCARAIFERALSDTANIITDPNSADTPEIDTWVQYAFSQANVLSDLLNCPEVQSAEPDETIIFETASYTFPQNNRKIDVNYETQKSVLKQKLLLASKKDLNPGDISPDIVADAANGVVWTNVDPAWYGIMVTEHGAFDEFVKPGKTNVIAQRYIEQNVKKLYPQDHRVWPVQASCTSRTAWAPDTDMINRAVSRTVGAKTPDYTPTTDEEKEQEKIADDNDFYVLGDGDLSFVTGLEIAADVIVSVATWGGYAAVKGVLTSLRGARAFNKIQKSLKALRASKVVTRWTKATKNVAELEKVLKNVDNVEDGYRTINSIEHSSSQAVKALNHKLNLLKAQKASPKAIKAVQEELEFATKQAKAAEKAANTANKIRESEQILVKGKDLSPAKQKKMKELEQRIEKLSTEIQRKPHKSGEAQQLQKQLKTLQQERNTLRNETKLTAQETQQLQNEIKGMKDTYSTQLKEFQDINAAEIAKLEKTQDIKDYKELVQAKRDIAHSVYLMRRGKIVFRANRGLLPVRAFRAAKALRKGLKSTEAIDKAAKIARANTSGISAKVNDWLFHNTMKNITAISKVPAKLSTFVVVAKAAGEMYDYTETSTGEFTNNINISPYLLLGADDLPEYENVVNYGMWLFWSGSSTSAADDDAAFLQAMNFAEKFHQDLIEVQDEYDNAACNVDIYVVRPIIRNPGTENEEIYFLIMNDVPWTTNGINNVSDETVQRQTNADGTVTYSYTNNANMTDNYMAVQDNTFNADMTSNYMAVQDNTFVAPNNYSAYQPSSYGRSNTKLSYTEQPYDGTKIGGPCTPPSTTANGFTNQILTTGRYANHPAFEKAMITKFRTEGGCGIHPKDKGGYTCYGVSSRYFPQVKKPGFSRADAEDIAWNTFFHKHNLDKLPDAISGDVFMALWGTGSKYASIGLLQQLLGVKQTGVVNQETIDAAMNYQGDLRTKYLDARENRARHGQSDFRQGWLNAIEVYRANGCHTNAN